MRAGFRACARLVSQGCRVWKNPWWLDIILQFSPAASTAADANTGGPPPARVVLSFLPPGATAAVSRDQIPTSLTARPRCNRPTTPTTFTAPSAIPLRRGGTTPSKLLPLLSDLISRRLSSVRDSHFPLDFVVLCFVADLPNRAWRPFGLEGESSLTSESLPEGRGLLLNTAVVVLLALVFVLVLRCRVGELCGVDGWRGPKNLFKPLMNHPLEGEPA